MQRPASVQPSAQATRASEVSRHSQKGVHCSLSRITYALLQLADHVHLCTYKTVREGQRRQDTHVYDAPVIFHQNGINSKIGFRVQKQAEDKMTI